MTRETDFRNSVPEEIDYDALLEPVAFDFSLSRRSFVQALGAGLLVTIVVPAAVGQRRGRGGRRGGEPVAVSARIHLGEDGTITVLSGKVDCGQGARGQIAQAAAEELGLALEQLDQITVVLADTGLVPDDGITAGSRTTPSTIPAVRQAAAAVRKLLVERAAEAWSVDRDDVEVRAGQAVDGGRGRAMSYAELARDAAAVERMAEVAPADVDVTGVDEWEVLGQPLPQPAGRAKVTGAHQYPSDIVRPGMLYGKVLRPETYRARLASVDLAPAEAMEEVVVVRDGEFVGVAAPTTHVARAAIEAIAETAEWEERPMPSSDELHDYLREHAEGGVPANPFADEVASAARSHRATYTVAYVQHAPLEPRSATAEWDGERLTVWTGTQNPFGVRRELQQAFRLSEDAVRVVVPDFGSGYGGKHTGEAAVEAARLAREAGRPVKLTWSREEEFTQAYFRPAGVIDMEASLDGENRVTSWWHVNISSGRQSIDAPYRFPKKESRHVRSRPPLREGSYRALASTANTFARESFMDELAALAGVDPLEFRLAQLDHPRLRPVLEEAAARFGWSERVKERQPNRGVGLACSLDKGSFVAACVEVEIEPRRNDIRVVHVVQAFECGPVMNPDNVRAQNEGAVVQALGPALSEEIRFEGGKFLNATVRQYRMPHCDDTPKVEVHLVDGRQYEPVGASETPVIAVAPAIANAVFHATGRRVRSMPVRLA